MKDGLTQQQIEDLAFDHGIGHVNQAALIGFTRDVEAQSPVLDERKRETAEVEYIVSCMAEDDRTGCGSKTDLGRDLECQVQKLYEQIESLQADADRYRWLRGQHWNESSIAVVCDPKKAVKLGGHCPYGEGLDEIIDAAMKRSGEQRA